MFQKQNFVKSNYHTSNANKNCQPNLISSSLKQVVINLVYFIKWRKFNYSHSVFIHLWEKLLTFNL